MKANDYTLTSRAYVLKLAPINKNLVLLWTLVIILLMMSAVQVSAEDEPPASPITSANVEQLHLLSSMEAEPATGGMLWLANSNDLIVADSSSVWKVNPAELEESFTIIHDKPVDSLIASSDGSTLAGHDSKNIYLWDVNNSFDLSILNQPNSDQLQLNNDGSILSFTLQTRDKYFWEAVIVVWDIANKQELKRFEYDSRVSSFVLDEKAGQIISGHANGTIQIKDWETGEQIYKLDEYLRPVTAISLSHNTKIIAYNGYRRSLQIAHTYDGKLIKIGLSSLMNAMAFTSDDSLIASSLILDPNISLRRTIDGVEVKVLREHTESIIAMAFNSDGSILATSGLDRMLMFWAILPSTQIS
jgi:WD40 repeat protein